MISQNQSLGYGPSVTIGIPVYNDEKYLPTALDDLLAQSFTNFKIIISDNASTDNTPKVCKYYAAKDSRIQYVRQPKNIGQIKNFGFLLSQAHSEFFMWAASDDRWHQDFIKSLIDSLLRNESLAVTFCPVGCIDEDGQKINGVKIYNFSGRNALIRLIRFNLNFDTKRDAFWYGIFRRKLIEDVRFRRWWWINSEIPMNLAYPLLNFVLVRGNYMSIGSQPLWWNRLHLRSKPRHSDVFYNQPTVYFFSISLRKINVAWFSTEEVARAGRSFWLTLCIGIILIIRGVIDFVNETIVVITKRIFRSLRWLIFGDSNQSSRL